MDKGISSVGTQYIICECGDNFPNERFLNIHLANNHGEVESFLCDQCPEAFTSNNSLCHHKRTHEKRQETPRKPEGIKTYTRKTPVKKDPVEKKPPVLKLKSLKRIDSISLIENLKSMGGFIKIEHVENSLEPEPDPEPPEATTSALEEATEEEVPVVVKNEAVEETEEIYYQCDVCNSIFYTEWDFNIHYQSKHALKLEPSAAELILEQHLASDHGVEAVAVKTEAEETAYYYECELGEEELHKPAVPTVNAVGKSVNAVKMTDSVNPDNFETEKTEKIQKHSENDKESTEQIKCLQDKEFSENSESSQTVNLKNNESTDDFADNTNMHVKSERTDEDENELLKVVGQKKRGGRPKKKKVGRAPSYDVYANMPPGLSRYQIEKLAKERKIQIRKEQRKAASRKYIKNISLEKRREIENKYKMKDPEKYAEIHRRSSAKYAKNHPEVGRRARKKYYEKKKLEKMGFKVEVN